ncbi:Protein kinase-like domain [Pseudocohnilembus persalinus]|uniref:Protein kinase-like domain n=1 Tax=Pseudocohnilembus persalinus TaxID=266149 RepID=A0A0V0Q9S2_PSEPJ|nr:Protein kinase-like domain [Pseudocohnilembus persalinus]|eukprot:KRW98946.1 Protein kinase-like domain [Pseudocohnilembus persalinus]
MYNFQINNTNPLQNKPEVDQYYNTSQNEILTNQYVTNPSKKQITLPQETNNHFKNPTDSYGQIIYTDQSYQQNRNQKDPKLQTLFQNLDKQINHTNINQLKLSVEQKQKRSQSVQRKNHSTQGNYAKQIQSHRGGAKTPFLPNKIISTPQKQNYNSYNKKEFKAKNFHDFTEQNQNQAINQIQNLGQITQQQHFNTNNSNQNNASIQNRILSQNSPVKSFKISNLQKTNDITTLHTKNSSVHSKDLYQMYKTENIYKNQNQKEKQQNQNISCNKNNLIQSNNQIHKNHNNSNFLSNLYTTNIQKQNSNLKSSQKQNYQQSHQKSSSHQKHRDSSTQKTRNSSNNFISQIRYNTPTNRRDSQNQQTIKDQISILKQKKSQKKNNSKNIIQNQLQQQQQQKTDLYYQYNPQQRHATIDINNIASLNNNYHLNHKHNTFNTNTFRRNTESQVSDIESRLNSSNNYQQQQQQQQQYQYQQQQQHQLNNNNSNVNNQQKYINININQNIQWNNSALKGQMQKMVTQKHQNKQQNPVSFLQNQNIKQKKQQNQNHQDIQTSANQNQKQNELNLLYKKILTTQNKQPKSKSADKLDQKTAPKDENKENNQIFKKQQVSMNRFNMSIKIGTGSYAVVKLGVDKETGQKIAVKIYNKESFKDPSKLKNVKREIQILSKLNHPNIIKLYHVIETENELNLVMEFIGLTSLFQYLKQNSQKRLSETQVRKIFAQIASGLNYLHQKNITHRDLKLENLLMSDVENDIKIIDFGFSIYTPNDRKLTSFCGTPSYMAPEIISKQEYLGPPVDIWCLGVLLYVLMCGQFPFKGKDEKELYQRITECQVNTPIHVPRGAANLINKILTTDVEKRPTAEDILNDSWIIGEYESEHFFSDQSED